MSAVGEQRRKRRWMMRRVGEEGGTCEDVEGARGYRGEYGDERKEGGEVDGVRKR
jgi:hypothetical protein